MNAIKAAIDQWRKKYALAIGMFLYGSFHAYLNVWSAGELTTFYAMLLAIFGAADLADNGAYGQFKGEKKSAETQP